MLQEEAEEDGLEVLDGAITSARASSDVRDRFDLRVDTAAELIFVVALLLGYKVFQMFESTCIERARILHPSSSTCCASVSGATGHARQPANIEDCEDS